MISSLWEVYEREINLDELIYDVKLVIKGREFKYKGFLDTGNTVYSYFEDVPIIFAEVKDSKILELIKENKKVNVKTITLSQVGEKTAYILEDIQISKGDNLYKVKAGIVFEHMNLSKSNDYNMILNYKLFNDQMGGIKV